jgi:hypothetical protein
VRVDESAMGEPAIEAPEKAEAETEEAETEQEAELPRSRAERETGR